MASNIIVMTRGDTYRFDVTVFDEADITARYDFIDKDRIYFGIMHPHQKFEDALIRKAYDGSIAKTSGRITITIQPEDTEYLEPGVYYYAIKLKKYDGVDEEQPDKEYWDIITLVNKTKLVLND